MPKDGSAKEEVFNGGREAVVDSPQAAARAPGSSLTEDAAVRVLAAVEALGADLRAEMARLRGAVEAFGTHLRTDITARIDRLQDQLITTKREGGALASGAAERAEHVATATRDEMGALIEQTGDLMQQIRLIGERLNQIERRR